MIILVINYYFVKKKKSWNYSFEINIIQKYTELFFPGGVNSPKMAMATPYCWYNVSA